MAYSFVGYTKPALSYNMWLGLVGARLHHGTHRAPVGAPLRRRAPLEPRLHRRAPIGPQLHCRAPIGPRSGPDCAIGPRSGRDCAVTLSFALQSCNTASSAKPVAVRSASDSWRVWCCWGYRLSLLFLFTWGTFRCQVQVSLALAFHPELYPQGGWQGNGLTTSVHITFNP